MIKINKGREPLAWTRKKSTPNFTEYVPIKGLRDQLLIEQGYICAFCMRTIPAIDQNVNEKSKIEHLKSRKDRPDLQLDFNNMVICCPGNTDNNPHCDKLKDGNSVSFDPFGSALQNSISYNSKNGEIISSNPIWNDEFKRLLNLNHNRIKVNRVIALNGVIEEIFKKGKTSFDLNKKLREWKELNKDGKLKPYCGIVIWYLQKKLRNTRNPQLLP